MHEMENFKIGESRA